MSKRRLIPGDPPAPLKPGETMRAATAEMPLHYYQRNPGMGLNGLNNLAVKRLLVRALNRINELECAR